MKIAGWQDFIFQNKIFLNRLKIALKMEPISLPLPYWKDEMVYKLSEIGV